jgi:glycosyltransferase involved in cell wall biosynthesis
MPQISVIVPLYNGESYIRETIQSVLSQTVQDFEIVVVDDGSTDRGKEIILRMESSIRYFYQENSGVTTARNQGFLNSAGEFIAFLDQDDRWYPHKLEVQARVLNERPEIGIVYSDIDLIDEAGRVIERKHLENRAQPAGKADNVFSTILADYPNPHPFPSTVMMRREIFIGSGMFDTAFKKNCYEDKELWFRIVNKRQGRFFFISEPLVQRRCHPLQGERDQEARDENWDVYWGKVSERLDDHLKAELHRKLARMLSREGKELIVKGDIERGRMYLKKSFRYDAFSLKNLSRFIRSYF